MPSLYLLAFTSEYSSNLTSYVWMIFPLAWPFPRQSYTPHIRRGTLNHNIFKCSFCTLITWWRVEDQNNNTRAAEETRRYRVLMQGKLTDRPHLNPLTTHDALYPNLWSIFHPKCVSCSFGFGSGFRAIFNVQHPTLLACNSSCGNQCAADVCYYFSLSTIRTYRIMLSAPARQKIWSNGMKRIS